MRRSTVLSLPLQLVFPDQTNVKCLPMTNTLAYNTAGQFYEWKKSYECKKYECKKIYECKTITSIKIDEYKKLRV
jgi:hypothetical protein